MRESNKNKQRKLKQCLPFAGQNKLNWEEKKNIMRFLPFSWLFLLKFFLSWFRFLSVLIVDFCTLESSDDDYLPKPNHQKNIECKSVNNIILKKRNS